MIVLAAVVVFRILGLDLAAIFALVRVAVTLVIIALTLRIPFKRNYHWMFLAVEVSMLWLAAGQAYEVDAITAAIAFARDSSLLTTPDWGFSRVQVLFIFQFVVYFVSRRVTLWEKLVLVGGYIYVIATVWVPTVFDHSFLSASAHTTVFGQTIGPGTADAYLRPYGIDIFSTPMAVLIFYLLIRYYRSEKSDLVRGQTKFLIVGMVIVFLGFYALYFSRYLGWPNFQNLIAAPGDFVLLLGLQKRGFYSVAPAAEKAIVNEPLRYPLEGGRSYLARDSKASFEAFSNLVRNGHSGLLVTRTFPDDVRTKYALETTPIRWLAEETMEDSITPSDLTGLSITLKEFIQRATKPVVMLHGVEYLTTINGFTPILRLIEGLNDVNAQNRGILLLPLVPDSLEKKEEALLVAETTPLPMPS